MRESASARSINSRRAMTYEQHAARAWPFLVEMAKAKRIFPYSDLADALGLPHRSIGRVLEPIENYLLDEKLPPLTILAVRKHGPRLPGTGFVAWDLDDFDAGVANVYRFNWAELDNPFEWAEHGKTIVLLAARLLRAQSSAREVLALVKSRGIGQRLLRSALLEAYNGRCAFCGLSFDEVLDAAHLVPWSDANNDQRLDIGNALLLCSNHHRLLDCGYLTVSKSFCIEFTDPATQDGDYTRADLSLSVALHGAKMRLPGNSNHWPAQYAIEWHRKHVAEL